MKTNNCTSNTQDKKEESIIQQYLDLKKHSDNLLLFRCEDFYVTFKDDAVKASKILGITLTKSNRNKDEEGNPLVMAGFPYHGLDIYLSKLIRAGERITIHKLYKIKK